MVELVQLSLCIYRYADHGYIYMLTWFPVTSFTGSFMWNVMHSAWIVMNTLMLEGVC